MNGQKVLLNLLKILLSIRLIQQIFPLIEYSIKEILLKNLINL